MEEALKFIYNKGSRPVGYAVTVRNLGMCQWEANCMHIRTKIKTLVTMWSPEVCPIHSRQCLTLHVLPTHFRECSSNPILAHLPVTTWWFPELPLVTLASSFLISAMLSPNSFMVSKYLVIIRTDKSPWDILTYLIISADTGEQLDGCGLTCSAGVVWRHTLLKCLTRGLTDWE